MKNQNYKILLLTSLLASQQLKSIKSLGVQNEQ